eukprot:1996254-Prymnesium_polylepis.2
MSVAVSVASGWTLLATPPLSNIDELAQMMAESTIDDVLRPSVHELGNSGIIALFGITAPDGAVNHPNRPADMRNMPPGTLAFRADSQRKPTSTKRRFRERQPSTRHSTISSRCSTSPAMTSAPAAWLSI